MAVVRGAREKADACSALIRGDEPSRAARWRTGEHRSGRQSSVRQRATRSFAAVSSGQRGETGMKRAKQRPFGVFGKEASTMATAVNCGPDGRMRAHCEEHSGGKCFGPASGWNKNNGWSPRDKHCCPSVGPNLCCEALVVFASGSFARHLSAAACAAGWCCCCCPHCCRTTETVNLTLVGHSFVRRAASSVLAGAQAQCCCCCCCCCSRCFNHRDSDCF